MDKRNEFFTTIKSSVMAVLFTFVHLICSLCARTNIKGAALPNSGLNCSVVRFHRHSFNLFLKPWQRRKQINASLLKNSWSKGNKETEARTQIRKLSLKIGLTLA